MKDEWIGIPNWDGPEGFQHYSDRDPIWIKNYTRLLSHDGYRDLTMNRRGILHGIWLAYASSAGRVRGDTLSMTRLLGQRVLSSDLISLSDAGFIEILASPHARPRARERDIDQKEVEAEQPTVVTASSNRSEETQPPRSTVNGHAADLSDDIPLPPVAPFFPCPYCDHVEPTWSDYTLHLTLDHPEVPA